MLISSASLFAYFVDRVGINMVLHYWLIGSRASGSPNHVIRGRDGGEKKLQCSQDGQSSSGSGRLTPSGQLFVLDFERGL